MAKAQVLDKPMHGNCAIYFLVLQNPGEYLAPLYSSTPFFSHQRQVLEEDTRKERIW